MAVIFLHRFLRFAKILRIVPLVVFFAEALPTYQILTMMPPFRRDVAVDNGVDLVGCALSLHVQVGQELENTITGLATVTFENVLVAVPALNYSVCVRQQMALYICEARTCGILGSKLGGRRVSYRRFRMRN